MRCDEEFIVIPCDCGELDHAIIYHVSKWANKETYITIRFPLYHESESFLARFKNLFLRRYSFSLNNTIDGMYFPLVEYLWKISFPGRISEHSVMEFEDKWKLCFLESKITLGVKLTATQKIHYLRYGTIDYPFEIFIDKEGPSANNHERIY